MLAMERLPLSQPPFSGNLSLSSPTMHSPRAGIPAPLIQGLPSPPALHSSHHGIISSHPQGPPKVRPSSSSSLSSVPTPPPYGDTTMMGSAGPPVYSPPHTGTLLPSSGNDRHDHLTCHGTGTDPSRHAGGIAMPSLTSLIGHQSLPIVSSAQESSCGPSSSSVCSTREHQSSSPSTGESLFEVVDLHTLDFSCHIKINVQLYTGLWVLA